MISKEEFNAYKESILSEKDKETYAKKVHKQKITERIVYMVEALVAITAFIVTLCLAKVKIMLFFPLFLSLFMFFFTFAITKTIKMKRLAKVKREKLPELMKYLVGDQFNSFAVDECLSEEDFNSSGFSFGTYNSYKGEDLLDVDIPKDNGERSGVSFKVCDLNVTRETRDSEGHPTTITVYKGAFCAVKFPFEFKCSLAINSRLGGVEKIKLEDVSFNKSFQVYTNNQVEALCILTPSMMQKLVKLKERTREVKVTIYGNRLYIGFPNMNLFELSSTSSGFSGEIFDAIYNDVALILSLVDELKTNNRIIKM